MTETAARHLAVCRRFGESVAAADGRWHQPSPCDAWDARAVLEHVIGFHDVLILRPLGRKPDRPRDDPTARWQLTYRALADAVDDDAMTGLDAWPMMPNLSRDVLIHAWDLARAVGADDRLDVRLCEQYYADLPDSQLLTAGGMFDTAVAAPAAADMQSKLLARLGRDPDWRPPRAG